MPGKTLGPYPGCWTKYLICFFFTINKTRSSYPALTNNFIIPQRVENNSILLMDASGTQLTYDGCMLNVYLADTRPEERSALRLLMEDMKMKVIGEGADWATTFAQAPELKTDILLIDWDLLPEDATIAIRTLRNACPSALMIVLISHLDARHQAALSAGADSFISKGEAPQRMLERLRSVINEMNNKKNNEGSGGGH